MGKLVRHFCSMVALVLVAALIPPASTSAQARTILVSKPNSDRASSTAPEEVTTEPTRVANVADVIDSTQSSDEGAEPQNEGGDIEVSSYELTAPLYRSQAFSLAVSDAPTAPEISSTTHPDQNGWFDNSRPAFTWTEPVSTSGVDGYSYVLDQSETTTPDDTSEGTERAKTYDTDQPEGVSHFHVKARSGSGLWGATGHYTIRIDRTNPSQPQAVVSTSHVPGVALHGDIDIDMVWEEALDLHSGVAHYEYSFQPEDQPPDWDTCACPTTPADQREATSADLDDGRYTFYVRAIDQAGNAGPHAGYGPLIVDEDGSVIPLNPSLSDALVAQSDTSGMEQFYPYSRSPLGTATAFTNLHSGNLVVRQRLGTVPAKGLNTVLNLTYNSQRGDAAYHDTGVGRGWSLSVSDLDSGTDFAGGLTEVDINAPVVVSLADVVGGGAGLTGGVLELTDGDGTSHRFIRKGTPGSHWDSPPGIDLKVREHLDDLDQPVSYDLIRPDGVVYNASRNILETGPFRIPGTSGRSPIARATSSTSSTGASPIPAASPTRASPRSPTTPRPETGAAWWRALPTTRSPARTSTGPAT